MYRLVRVCIAMGEELPTHALECEEEAGGGGLAWNASKSLAARGAEMGEDAGRKHEQLDGRKQQLADS